MSEPTRRANRLRLAGFTYEELRVIESSSGLGIAAARDGLMAFDSATLLELLRAELRVELDYREETGETHD